MFRANVPLGESLGFLCGKLQHAVALDREWHFDRGGKAFSTLDASFNFLADFIVLNSRANYVAHQRRVRAHETKKKVFCFYILATVLARLVPREENHSAGRFCVAFEHADHPVRKASGCVVALALESRTSVADLTTEK
jgi:hypothetical protein